MSRWEQIKSNAPRERGDNEEGDVPPAPQEIHLPEIPAPYDALVGLFHLSGQALQTGWGLCPLTWVEIDAFVRVNDLDLTLWERELLKKMSEAYCAEYSRASDPKRPAPYQPEQTEEVDQIAKAMRIMDSLSAFRKT
jgi:hypothetical protein